MISSVFRQRTVHISLHFLQLIEIKGLFYHFTLLSKYDFVHAGGKSTRRNQQIHMSIFHILKHMFKHYLLS